MKTCKCNRYNTTNGDHVFSNQHGNLEVHAEIDCYIVARGTNITLKDLININK